MSPLDPAPPPSGEEIHLPGPSWIPLVNAIGLTVLVVGLAVGWSLVIGGGVIFLVTLVIWIRDTRRDIDELPLDHSAH